MKGDVGEWGGEVVEESFEWNGCNARMRVLRFARMKGWEMKVWKLRLEVCIVLHFNCEEFSIRFNFEMAWNGKKKEEWGVISAWKG